LNDKLKLMFLQNNLKRAVRTSGSLHLINMIYKETGIACETGNGGKEINVIQERR